MNNNLGFIRLLAAFGVLFGHSFNHAWGLPGHPGPVSQAISGVTPFNIGLPGVCVFVFFSISGYLVTKSFCVRENVYDFLESRILRIYPAAIVAIAFTAFVIGTAFTTLPIGEYLTHDRVSRFFIKNIGLWDLQMHLPGLFKDNPRPGPVNGSLWTLPVEIRMYLMVLVFGVLMIFRKVEVFNALMITLIAVYLADPENFAFTEKGRHIYLFLPFIFGAFFYINRNRIPLRVTYAFASLPIMFFAWGESYYDILVSLWLTYSILAISFLPKARVLDIDRFGDFSYGVYLYAFPVSQSLVYLFGFSSPWVLMVFTALITFVLAMLSWFYIEKPMLSFKGKSRALFRSLPWVSQSGVKDSS